MKHNGMAGLLAGLLLMPAAQAAAQRRVLVYDRVQNVPVAYANVYKAEGGTFRGTTSDGNGVAVIDFGFHRLRVSHVGYQSCAFTVLPDTIFLTPKENQLAEVVVRDEEPQWIRPWLQRLVGEKRRRYRAAAACYDYDYTTRSTSDSSGYWFENKGKMRIPAFREKQLFRIKPGRGYIHFKDVTAGCDFSNLKRMVYHDFVDELDARFIRQHVFRVNDAFRSGNRNIVQLYFKSAKYGREDRGYLTVDTAMRAVLAVSRETGLRYNVDNHTNRFTRGAVGMLTGWRYSEWLVSSETRYHVDSVSCYPSVCRYKAYLLAESAKGRFAGRRFESYEAELTLSPAVDADGPAYIDLPEPWYMKLILGKKERLAEERLQSIPKEHVVY